MNGFRPDFNAKDHGEDLQRGIEKKRKWSKESGHIDEILADGSVSSAEEIVNHLQRF